jgi:hypothetical protein
MAPERQRLDVADRPADLDDVHVGPGRERERVHAPLDLVGDVRDHLHGAPKVIAASLARQDGVVDLPGGDVVAARDRQLREALVVAEVQVGLGAVVGDEHLAMLERAHRAGIDVQVGIELLDGDAEAARLEKQPQRRRGDSLA